LVVFNETVRENLLIDNPEKKYFFTKTQCELINGIPLKEGQQDDLETDLLSMSDDEVLFWKRKNIEPDFMYVERGL